ncbi:uncharacterized protein METZ01_LOCUS127886, partial [marine metagenome]
MESIDGVGCHGADDRFAVCGTAIA